MAEADGRFVEVAGGRIWARVVGEPNRTPVVLLHGGPGCPHDYLEAFEQLADERQVVFYDQLGCGRSDRPHDDSLWTLGRFLDELETLLDALALGRVHLVGHSWGAMLGLDFALARPSEVAGLVLDSPCLSMRRVREDMARLKAGLPAAVLQMIERCEAEGKTQSGAYQAAASVFYRRHICRMPEWPEPLTRAEAEWGWNVYRTMWGPAEFTPTGNLADYEREDRLRELRCRVLYVCGRHDEMTPETTQVFHAATPGSEFIVFENSAHLQHLEEPDLYFPALRDFLRRADDDVDS